VATPFVNGTVEGTEFLVRVAKEQTFLSVFEGKVTASNEAGSLLLASGQSAVALKGQAPALTLSSAPGMLFNGLYTTHPFWLSAQVILLAGRKPIGRE
jgi:hypothetical protein